MVFNLSLPPLVVLLLLAFLWLVLLVLLLWFAFKPRRDSGEFEEPETRPRSQPRRDGLEATPKPRQPKVRSSQPVSTRTTVRAVSKTKPDTEADLQNDFDDFNRPGNRRDDFDF